MRIIINFLFPLLFIAAIILVIYAITFSISSIKSKSTKGRKRALLLGLCSFVFLAASLTLFTFKKRSVKHKIIAKLHGSYFYFDSSKNDISNRDPLNQPRLDLKADMSFFVPCSFNTGKCCVGGVAHWPWESPFKIERSDWQVALDSPVGHYDYSNKLAI